MKALAIAYAIVYLLAILLSGWVGIEVRRFVKETTSIADPETLERFKAIARRNMRLALVQIVFLGSGLLLGIVLIVVHGVPALLVVLATNAVLIAISRYLGHFEKLARSLPAATPALEAEHQRVSKVWVSQMLPDF